MKRAYKIEIERRPYSPDRWLRPDRYEYVIIAGSAEEACGKAKRAAAKDTGYGSPWFIKTLTELGEAV